MGQHNFIQRAHLFTYVGTECLRNEYYHNDCRLCIDICPKGAFSLFRNKLTLSDDACVSCAACIGGCPTEALGVENFDSNAFVAGFKEAESPKLSCKENTPCLGVFDTSHLLTMALRAQPPLCDLSHCAECALNVGGKIEARIRGNVDEANRFFESVGSEQRLETIEEAAETNSRRALFRKAMDKVKEQAVESHPALSMTLEHQRNATARVPLKMLMLKNSIKEHLSDFKTTTIPGDNPLFTEKRIDFQACTNCGDCAQFCPTEALFLSGDKHGINFIAGKCIGCNICGDICKSAAVSTAETCDLVTVVYDRPNTLVHYEMVQCHECRCPYPYKGGDPICDRCKDFKADFSTMFTMAKDL